MAAVILGVQTWECELAYSDEYIQLTSLPDRKKVRRLQADELPGAWSFLTVVENQLVDDLLFYTSGSVVKLTRTQLEKFGCMCDRAEAAKLEWEKQEEKVEVLKDSIGDGVLTRAKQVEQTTVAATADNHSYQQIGRGIDHAEQRIDALQKAVKGTDSGFYMVIYDIPVTKNKQCPNPSGVFWRYGFRLNDSCWVFTGKGLNADRIQNVLAHWQIHNIETFIVRYHDEEVDQIRAIAQLKLENEIRRIHTSLINTIANADDSLQEAMKAEGVTAGMMRDAEKARDGSVRQRINLANGQLEAAISCAEHFDNSENVQELLKGLRHAVRSAALTFNKIAREKNLKRVSIP